MSKLMYSKCSECGTRHQIHRHELSSPNRESLHCPDCGSELIAWNGRLFYTLAIREPKPTLELRNETGAIDQPLVRHKRQNSG